MSKREGKGEQFNQTTNNTMYANAQVADKPTIYSILTKEMQELLDSGATIPGFSQTFKHSPINKCPCNPVW